MSEKEFLEQIRSHQAIIYKVVNLYASDAEERKDLYQEVVLQCWKGWESFRGESKFSTWLYRVSLNTVFTAKRKKNRIDYPEHAPEEVGVGPSVLENERAEVLYAAIRRLPETDRAIITLHLDGYANQEIAEMMGITANSINVKLFRIRERLSNLLIPRNV